MVGGIGKVSKEQSRQVSLALHPWLPPQQLDFSQFYFFLLLHDILWTKSPRGKMRLQTADLDGEYCESRGLPNM